MLKPSRDTSGVWPWACFRPLPCRQTARTSGCKGARKAREPATNPCSATGASGSHFPLPSLLAPRWARPARTRNPDEKNGRWPGQITPTCAKYLPCPKPEPVSPLSSGVPIRQEFLFGTAQSEIRDGSGREDLTPMSSRGPPLAVLGVNLSHEYGPE
jgi:hypothetical protein